jgi:hypothetical protein
VLLGGELPVGHEIGLIVAAALFIAFALASSFLIPRYKPDYPGAAGMGVFIIAAIAFFVVMVGAVNFFG